MMPLNQSNAPLLINKVAGVKGTVINIKDKVIDAKDKIVSIKEGTEQSLEVIATLSKKVLDFIDFTSTILFNPEVALAFVDKMSIVIIISLLLLKMLGFKDLEKWILLSILVKVVTMAL